MRQKPQTSSRPKHPTLRLAALLIATWAQAQTSSEARAQFADWLSRCQLSSSVEALCGSHEVWEDRHAQAGRKIAINVVVVPAPTDSPSPDPVFYLHGGPGAGATSAATTMLRRLAEVHERRDLVFVDLRGTGKSNPLNCEQPDLEAPLQEHFTELFPDDFVRDCLERQDADVALYTVIQAVDDLEEVREALGYDRINLYGGSGGTRTAQVFIARYPASTRTAVMKGVVPMDMESPLPFAKALEVGIDALIEACRAESECNDAYPSLRADWTRSKRRFDDGPVEAEVDHPSTGKREKVTIDKGVYADGVRHILYSVGASRQLPGMIHLAAKGNYDLFAQRELVQSIGFNRLISMGSFMTSTCAEDLRFITEEEITRATANTFLGDYRVRRQLAACRIWGFGHGIDESFQDPVTSDVPALLISGAYDTATPPEGGERVVAHLPNGRHVIFPNQSHGYANPTCESQLVADFIESADTNALDISCVSDTVRPAFDTTIGR